MELKRIENKYLETNGKTYRRKIWKN